MVADHGWFWAGAGALSEPVRSAMDEDGISWHMVLKVGVEPTPQLRDTVLSRARLPFRHFSGALLLYLGETQNKKAKKESNSNPGEGNHWTC